MARVSIRLGAGLGGIVLAMAAGVVSYWEGYVPHTYADPIGIPTACYGHTGADVQAGQTYTRGECEALLTGDLTATFDGLQSCIHADLRPNEWAALVSLGYNVGYATVCRSTIAKMIDAGAPAAVWCAQFARWVYAGGRRLQGLVNRRAAEQRMCLGQA